MTLELEAPQFDCLDDIAATRRTVQVLHVINGEHYAGAERVQDLLAARLPECGYSVGFAALKPGKFATARHHRDAPLFNLSMRSSFDVRPAWKIATLVRDAGYSLIHTHTPRAALIGRIASRLAGVPMVHHIHSPTVADTTHRMRRWMNGQSEKFSLRGVDAFVTVSHTLAGYVARRGLRARSVHVVHNGVPTPGPLSHRNHPNDVWTLGTVALFRPRKGLEILLDALAMLRVAGLPVRLRIIGSFETPDYARQIRAHVARLDLDDAIEWTGFCHDVMGELANLDLFVLPSLFGEGLPMVLLEAMAAGVPVVATRVEGVPEAVRDERDGLLAMPGDATDLARQIGRVVRGVSDWSELRESAYERQRSQFSDSAMAAGVADVYDHVLRSANHVVEETTR